MSESPLSIPRLRLYNLHISQSRCEDVGSVVKALGAMQAQDYAGTLWALALRLPGSTEEDVLKAIRERQIIRTWPMRGTLHLVPAEDAKWMLSLLTPRMIARSAGRFRELELDDKVFTRCEKIITKALTGGKSLSRPDVFALLNAAKISTDNQRGYHILNHLCMKGVLCFSEHSGKQPSFALLDEWVGHHVSMDREQSLATLATRYFTSHGPATLDDFAWWAGLTLKDARAAIALMDKSQLQSEKLNDMEYWFLITAQMNAAAIKDDVYLLPGFDEYLLGYTDRSAVLDAEHASRIVPGNNGMFMPTLIVEGRVAGTWKRIQKKNQSVLSVIPFEPLSKKNQRALSPVLQAYTQYAGHPVTLGSGLL